MHAYTRRNTTELISLVAKERITFLISLPDFNLPLIGSFSDSRRPGLTETRPIGGEN